MSLFVFGLRRMEERTHESGRIGHWSEEENCVKEKEKLSLEGKGKKLEKREQKETTTMQ